MNEEIPKDVPSLSPEQHKDFKEFEAYFINLFYNANSQGTLLDYLCTLLRVSGTSFGHWDPFVEAEDALSEYGKLLERESELGNKKSIIRLGLLIYCHATEMSAPYEILGNLLRCKQEKPFQWDPFFHLIRRKKNDPLGKRVPPSPKSKIKLLREEAKLADEEKLIEIIDSFYDDDLRNAFYHSDYCITEDEFRIASGVGKVYTLDEVTEKLSKCFAFYMSFFHVYKQAKITIDSSEQKVFKMQGYETLEILTNPEEGLYGFKVHYSNGAHSEYQRKKDKSFSLNLSVESEGISLFVGDTSKLEKKWKIDGKELE